MSVVAEKFNSTSSGLIGADGLAVRQRGDGSQVVVCDDGWGES
jgi:hypothetical protein